MPFYQGNDSCNESNLHRQNTGEYPLDPQSTVALAGEVYFNNALNTPQNVNETFVTKLSDCASNLLNAQRPKILNIEILRVPAVT